jgi:hypothetical protein
MTTTRTTHPPDDPLGYDGTVLQRLRKMAEDELAGVNADVVSEESAVLRARLGLRGRKLRIWI